MTTNNTRIISTGNEELDAKLAGGIPFPSLIIIEGDHGAGKSVVTQQFIFGALKSSLKVIVVTTELTSIGYIKHMEQVGFPVLDYYVEGRLTVYTTQLPWITWSPELSRFLLPITSNYMILNIDQYDVFVIDSLSHLITYAKPSEILDFFKILRRITDKGKLIIVTIHPNTVQEELLTRARAICDGYIRLKNAVVGGRPVKIMNVVKLKGAPTIFESNITFDVDPAFGIKIIPLALAKA